MSLKQEERDIMVALEMEKADCTFAEHEGLTEKGYWSNLARIEPTRSLIEKIKKYIAEKQAQ